MRGWGGVLTATGGLIQIHLLEPLKEEKCLCADKFGHIEGRRIPVWSLVIFPVW